MEAVPPYIRESDGTIRQGSTTEIPNGWDLEFPEKDLSFIRIDHQTRLQFGPTEVVIESPFTLRTPTQEAELDPGERGDLGLLLELYPTTLLSASIDAGATLDMSLADGYSVSVPADPHYEAWQVNGPGTFLVVCLPGSSGRVSIWK
jgi:hypothetical protein